MEKNVLEAITRTVLCNKWIILQDRTHSSRYNIYKQDSIHSITTAALGVLPIAAVKVEQFQGYPPCMSNTWSWGNGKSADILRLLTKNASRTKIGYISQLQYFLKDICGRDLKRLMFDLARCIAKSKGYRVFLFSTELADFVPNGTDIEIIHPSGLKSKQYLVYRPLDSVKGQLIKMSEVKRYITQSSSVSDIALIQCRISQYAKSKKVRITRTLDYISGLTRDTFENLSRGYIHYDVFETLLSQDGVITLWCVRDYKICGVVMFSPFHKDSYPPPITANGEWDDADPVFYYNGQNITSSIYRGYELHVICSTRGLGRLLLAQALLDIRRMHGRSVVLTIGCKDGRPCEDAVKLYKEFGFDSVDVRFSLRLGNSVWKTQASENDPVEELTWMHKHTTISSELITEPLVLNALQIR